MMARASIDNNVKTPARSEIPADIYTLIDMIPVDRLFTTANQSGCPPTPG